MRIKDMNWMQVEAYLKRDDRAVLPVGSTEQHAQLSLMVDCILSERVSVDAAEPLGVPVFPPVNYGITPYFRAFPGTISLRLDTFLRVIRDVLDSLADQGFRRIVIVNGHGGNAPAGSVAQEWMMDNPDAHVRFHDWWRAPLTSAAVRAIDPVASHASWMENFPWTRLPNRPPQQGMKRMIDTDLLRTLPPFEVRTLIDDGNFGGRYQRDDSEMLEIWDVAVQETRALLESW